MFRDLLKRSPSRSSTKPARIPQRSAPLMLEQLEGRQLMSTTLGVDYVAGYTGDFFYSDALIKGHNGHAYGNGHKLTGAI